MQLGNFVKYLLHSALLCASINLMQPLASAQDAAPQPAPASSLVSDAQVEANVLKALAGASQLANEKITTTTVYGEVTLSGSVRDEPARVLAETLASRAPGVKKVIDELTLSTDQTSNAAPPPPDAAMGTNPNLTNPNLQSDGTMVSPDQYSPPGQTPAQGAQGGDPNHSAAAQAPAYGSGAPPPYGPGAPEYQQGYPGQPRNAPRAPSPYPAAPAPYYAAAPSPYPAAPYSSASGQPAPYGAQLAGVAVVVPSGAMLRVRINQGLDSKHSQPGTTFDGTVVNDIIADGAVAIPRGATVQGSVFDARSSGSLGGRGELQLQLTQVVLAGKVFPLVSDHWSSVGPDKTARTVSNTVGLGAIGALIGAVAGGGAGAAIGAGAGAAAGLGTSAASGSTQALIPPEAILTFHLAQAAPVTTVSQAEMDRLGYGVPTGAQRPGLVRRSYPNVYYGPGYPAGPYPAYYPYR